jgi:hypothetical protein
MFELWKQQMDETDAFLLAVRCGERNLDYSNILRLAEPSDGEYWLSKQTIFDIIRKAFEQGAKFERESQGSRVFCSYCGDPYPEGSLFEGACIVCHNNFEAFKKIWEK